MPDPSLISPQTLRNFLENPVWLALEEIYKSEMNSALVKAIDEQDPKAAGRYRAYESVFATPKRWLEDANKEKPKKARLWR